MELMSALWLMALAFAGGVVIGMLIGARQGREANDDKQLAAQARAERDARILAKIRAERDARVAALSKPTEGN